MKSFRHTCTIKKKKKNPDQNVFGNIASLAKLVLTLPHSNAETEDFFNAG